MTTDDVNSVRDRRCTCMERSVKILWMRYVFRKRLPKIRLNPTANRIGAAAQIASPVWGLAAPICAIMSTATEANMGPSDMR